MFQNELNITIGFYLFSAILFSADRLAIKRKGKTHKKRREHSKENYPFFNGRS
jgi:hypothetical protein